MNEAETRAERIDPALAAAGWGEVAGSRIRREYPITLGRLEGGGRRGRSLTADYVLEYRSTRLAVVEAKSADRALTEGVGQAKDYASKLAIRFAYATNGNGFYGIDMQTGHEGEVADFPGPEALWQATFATQNVWRDRFAAVPFEDRGGYFQGRYYQDIAIERVLAVLAGGRDRILLTLATGTGKTFIAFQLAWKLFHSRWNLADWHRVTAPVRRPRILFLADRNTLADQAFNAFSAFPEDALVRIAPDAIRRKGRVPKNGSVFFTIFQTFMSGADGRPYFGDYPPDFFDFVIIDECHRGGANDEGSWRGILDYFAPAVQLGLTATPKRQENADTYAYFGAPVFTYSLKDGINDGFLTPFRLKQIATTLDEYVYTEDDTLEAGEIEAGRRYVEADFNRRIEIVARERKRVDIFMTDIDPSHKTLVFCATQAHALLVRDLINQRKTLRDPDYCQRVTAEDGRLGDEALRAFQDNEKSVPTILTTSQKLSTGVDARNVRNIVLMREVNSMIEFKQIIGRGTRLFDGKDYFTIYDFVKAHQHFNDPEWDGEPLPPDAAAVCERCARAPCVCAAEPPVPCYVCGQQPCACPREACKVCGSRPCTCRRKATVRLADGKARQIQHIMATSFWHPDGTPMSAAQFLEALYGRLPAFFADEDELRAIWSVPDTRRRLLDGLAEQGIGAAQLAEMQHIIEADDSDLFDVLAYVAFAQAPRSREARAQRASLLMDGQFTDRQRAFLDFVLGHYVSAGVAELDEAKLGSLLRLRYHNALADAFADLGSPEVVRDAFVGFQRYLYARLD